MRSRTAHPAWLRAPLRALSADAARFRRRDPDRDPTAAAKARVRSALAERLAAAYEAGEGCVVAVRLELARQVEGVDVWIDSATAGEVDGLVQQFESGADDLAAIAQGLAVYGPPEHERLASEAIQRLMEAGTPRRAREYARRAMDSICQSESARIRHEAFETVGQMARSLSVPAWTASNHFRSAIAVLDRQMHQDMERLDTHAGWLAVCPDPWSDPGAAMLMASIRQGARRRRTLAVAAQRRNWAGLGSDDREAMLRAARRIVAGEDGPETYEQLEVIASKCAMDLAIQAALAAVDWPEDPLERISWLPPDECLREAGELLMSLEASRWFAQMRSSRRWRAACDQSEERAAALLACLNAASAYHA
ncbi:MAG: hypothetical protein QF561_05595 [Phycisphaerales bacterium]|jgi:hypothetical protein|nr:hypothetical protein [Phycisphaerales bacterium]